MNKLTQSEKDHLIGYATGLQDIMKALTGENTCAKSYDPISFEDGEIISYAFDMKDGGRKHDLSDYRDIKEIKETLLIEAVNWCKEK